MKNNKGFTLVEILAVVVVLGIVVLISTNIVLKQLDKSRKQAFITDVQQYIKSTNYDTLVKDNIDQFVIYRFPNTGIDILGKKTMKDDNGNQVPIESGYMIKDENENVRIQIWNKKLKLCAVKPFDDENVKIDKDIQTEEDCNSFLYNLKDGDEISVKSLTGENINKTLKTSCYSLDEDMNITNFNTSECGTSLIIPNKINGEYVNGFGEDFTDDVSKDFTSLYMMGVKNVTLIPTSFLSNNSDLKKMIIFDMPNLETINSGLGWGSSGIVTFYLADCPKLENMYSGVAGSNSSPTDLEYITLENLPKLNMISAAFSYSKPKKLVISNLNSLTSITSSAFTNLSGDSEIYIVNNDSLQKIENSSFYKSYIKKLEIANNNSFEKITNGSITGDSGFYIDELLIHDNPNFTTIDNSSFSGYEYNTIKLYNMPNLQHIQYGAFGGIKADLVDLSGLQLTELNLSSWSGSKIEKLVLPPTISSVTYGSISGLNSIVTGHIEFGGADKCSLIGLFRTSNGDGTYNYLVDKNKLPSCP